MSDGPDADGRIRQRDPHRELRAHPLADEVDDDVVVLRVADAVVALTALRADLLLTARRAGATVRFETPARSRLTEPLRGALQEAGGRWVVTDASGRRWNGLTGAEAALERAPARETRSPAFLAGAEPESEQLVVTGSVRHRRDRPSAVGVLLSAVTTGFAVPGPAVYGPHEPLVRPWDAAEAGRLLLSDGAPLRLLVGGGPGRPLTGSLLVRRTRVGFEEVVDVRLPVGVPGEETEARARDGITAAFELLAAEVQPLFALALLRRGRHDLTTAPVLPFAPTPLALLIGPPGVRDLGLDTGRLTAELGAVPVGRPRVPAVLLPLGGTPEGWTVLHRFVEVVGADRVAAAFGRPLPEA